MTACGRLSSESPAADAEFRAYLDGFEASPNDIFTICWTSGTTGQPKGVPRSHNMWMASAIGAHDAAVLQDGDTLLNPFPIVNMAAIGGFLYCWLMRAATLVLHHPFDMQVFLKLLCLKWLLLFKVNFILNVWFVRATS